MSFLHYSNPERETAADSDARYLGWVCRAIVSWERLQVLGRALGSSLAWELPYL